MYKYVPPSKNGAHIRGTIYPFIFGCGGLAGIATRGSPKLNINELARELFWFCLRPKITYIICGIVTKRGERRLG
jgi:hypothetical protein